jgi:hypothetical protein
MKDTCPSSQCVPEGECEDRGKGCDKGKGKDGDSDGVRNLAYLL